MFVSFFFFKQDTAYEMRISDWSSDVCSSDLAINDRAAFKGDAITASRSPQPYWRGRVGDDERRQTFIGERYDKPLYRLLYFRFSRGAKSKRAEDDEIGRASCRERVCTYV